jgi:hypothetical protein
MVDLKYPHLEHTYEELKGKTVIISLIEEDEDGGYDENKEFVVVNNVDDYLALDEAVAIYSSMGIFDDYYMAK